MELRDPLPRHAKVAVLGLGAAGLGAVRLLDALGKHTIATDRSTDLRAELPGSVELRLGSNDFAGASAVVLSPGMNPDWPENARNPELAPLWAAWRAGEVEVWSEVDLAAAALDRPWIAVGGTDGKSTTAALAARLANATGRETLLGGNSWEAMSSVVAGATAADAAVIEVSAFQSWRGHHMRPAVSILTNIADDHLDHYASFDDYVDAKLLIHDHLDADHGVAIVWAGDPRLAAAAGRLSERGVRVVLYDNGPRPDAESAAWLDGDQLRVSGRVGDVAAPLAALRLAGAHNVRNALAALAAVVALPGARPTADALADGLAAFVGLPHRLELVRELDGVRYVDDSKATNVHAAVTGLRSLAPPLVAIVGGVDKRLDLGPLLRELADRARHVVVIGEVAARLEAEGAGVVSMERAGSMEAAVVAARAAARPGDTVVLSPACSSFDMFAGFEARGRAFAAAVRALAAR
ncbi:MAG: UDP-N-acetylmuramoyl-L-alanine--D-glutamate ligase [Myxococcales bacterium]|nr:UDP-N-acetylmuramoyl-L-alanine--D-glutamate ligase [Myxococcales bacterium]MCB9531165.1 UDP-N-acetylmuramoyl-L-alanine--D-glutamate ligase [Myxococcales bacterium]